MNMRSHSWGVYFGILFFLSQFFLPAAAAEKTGVLLLAHGGSAVWNREIESIQRSVAKEGYAIEVAFGMADLRQMQRGIDRLVSRHVKNILAIPLLVGSSSELYEQFEFALGLRRQPSKAFLEGMAGVGVHERGHHVPAAGDSGKQVKSSVPLALARALDSDPVVALILWDRAKTVSRQPENEAVLLVSHGPYTDELESRWQRRAEAVAVELKQKRGFYDVRAFNLRDDAPKHVRESKIKEIRAYAKQQNQARKRLLVLPHLIAYNGIEGHIRKALEGHFYKMPKAALLPHPLITQWVLEQIKTAVVPTAHD